MVEFGDELIIQSFKVPWLVWIQLLVTVLLIIILFFGVVIFSSDSLNSPASASPSAAVASGALTPTVNCSSSRPSSSNRIVKVEGQRGRMDIGTSGGSTEQEDQIEEGSVLSRIFRNPIHPCNYIGLATRALFKCFGLDSTSEGSRNYQHEKQE